MKNVFEELAVYLKETYFSPDFTGINNYDMTDVARFLPLMVVGLCIGVFVASCVYYYHSHFLGSVVRALYKAGAFCEAEARTLAEVGSDKRLIKRALGRENLLSRYVKRVDGEGEARYFIPESDKYIADKRFKEVRGGKAMLLIIFLICFFGCFALLIALPQFLQLFDNAVTMIKSCYYIQ